MAYGQLDTAISFNGPTCLQPSKIMEFLGYVVGSIEEILGSGGYKESCVEQCSDHTHIQKKTSLYQLSEIY